MVFSAENIKNDFPIFQANPKLVYLDSAATAHKPLPVLDAMYAFDKTSYGTIHRAVYSLAQKASERYFSAKKSIASFIKAESAEEIIFTKGTTESINLLASSFCSTQTKAGDEIILTEAEHHSNLVPWQEAAKRYHLKLHFAHILDDGSLDFEHFSSLLNNKTRLVALAHTSNALGTTFPIDKIVSAAHAEGAQVFVDAAQSIAHDPIDLSQVDIDYLAFSAHKLYGPTGIGVLYGKKDLLNSLSPYQFGGSMIERVTLENSTFASSPMRFEAGTPMITQAIGLEAACQYLETISLKDIKEYESSLTDTLLSGLKSIPNIRIIGEAAHRGPLVSFVAGNAHPLDIATFLDMKHIAVRSGHMCASPILERFQTPHAVRVSLGLYNTKKEIEFFLNQLEALLKKLS